MVEARVRRLPGYVERVELTRQKGPAYRLRQYASRVLGDMQLPDEVLRTADKKETTTPFGIISMRSQVVYRAAPVRELQDSGHSLLV